MSYFVELYLFSWILMLVVLFIDRNFTGADLALALAFVGIIFSVCTSREISRIEKEKYKDDYRKNF